MENNLAGKFGHKTFVINSKMAEKTIEMAVNVTLCAYKKQFILILRGFYAEYCFI